MSLTTFIEKLGLNPADFADEIVSLKDQESVGRSYCSYLGESIDPHRDYSWKGVIDIKVDRFGNKLFRFGFNKINGYGPMSYFWTTEQFIDGHWIVRNQSPRYEGCRFYPEKFDREGG